MGYAVTYAGALNGKEDMGRDLIASKGREVLVIQCKRYFGHPVRENTVFQTYGTSLCYQLENKDKQVRSVIYTTGVLSDVAVQCAEALSMEIHQNYQLEMYPLVKCNISYTGEKIYHLPFDQQYDNVKISPNRGECYARTCEEAELLGFRRVFRWKGTK